MSPPAAHNKLFKKLTDYYFVDGMPEAVKAWYQYKEASILNRIEAVRSVQQDLITSYQRDFGKYAGMLNASERWTHPVQNWNLTLSQLLIHFAGRLDAHIGL
jgi:transposase-like protein